MSKDHSKKMSSIEYASTLVTEEYIHIVELGTYSGKTLKKIKNTIGDSKLIFGFDSFEGLPVDWLTKDGNIAGKNKKSIKGTFNTNKVAPAIDGTILVPGWFEDSLPIYLNFADNLALVHFDCDLYSSTKIGFYYLGSYIRKNTILVFDEWFYNHDAYYDDHEQKAFYEWIEETNRDFEFIDFEDNTKSGEERKIVRILEDPKYEE